MAKWVQQAENLWCLDLYKERVYLTVLHKLGAYIVDVESPFRKVIAKSFVANSLEDAKQRAIEFVQRGYTKAKETIEYNLNTLSMVENEVEQ